MDILTYALARKYTDNALNGLGALKGAPCTILAVAEQNGNTVITFSWVGIDGTSQTQDVRIPYGLSDSDRTELEKDLRAYVEEQVRFVEPGDIDDGEI